MNALCVSSIDLRHVLFSCYVVHNGVRMLEDLSLKGLYRLISRSLHAFALLDLLRAAQDEKKLSVPWANLKKISFRNFVTSQVVHDEIKKMLVQLVGNACKAGEFVLADQMTTRLTAGCFQVRTSTILTLKLTLIFDNTISSHTALHLSLTLSSATTISVFFCW